MALFPTRNNRRGQQQTLSNPYYNYNSSDETPIAQNNNKPQQQQQQTNNNRRQQQQQRQRRSTANPLTASERSSEVALLLSDAQSLDLKPPRHALLHTIYSNSSNSDAVSVYTTGSKSSYNDDMSRRSGVSRRSIDSNTNMGSLVNSNNELHQQLLEMKERQQFQYHVSAKHHHPIEASQQQQGGYNYNHNNSSYTSRRDVWLALSILHLISIGSIATTTSNYTSSSSSSSTSEITTWSLLLQLLALCICLLVGIVGHFHTPFQEYITTYYIPTTTANNGNASSFKHIREVVTMEQILSTVQTLFTSISSGLLLYPNHNGDAVVAVTTNTSGHQVWNTNLFYSLWFGLYGSWMLLGMTYLFTPPPGAKRRRKRSRQSLPQMHLLWFTTLLSSIFTTISLFVIHSGPICSHGLEGTTYCNKSFTGALLSLSCAMISFGVGSWTLYYEKSLGSRRYEIQGRIARLKKFGTPKRGRSGSGTSSSTRSSLANVLCSTILLILSSTTVGIVSSPSGPKQGVGSVFLTSWMTFGLSVGLCKVCLECYFFPQPEEEEEELELPINMIVSDKNAKSLSNKISSSSKGPRRLRMMPNGSIRSGQTTTNDDSDYDNDDDEYIRAGDTDVDSDGASTASESEVLHCIGSIAQDVAESRIGVGLDPEGSTAAAADVEQGRHYRGGGYNFGEPPPAASSLASSAQERRDAQGSYYGASFNDIDDNRYYNESSNAYDADADSGYYSGSQAVRIRTGPQEEVSTLGGGTNVSRWRQQRPQDPLSSSAYTVNNHSFGRDPSAYNTNSMTEEIHNPTQSDYNDGDDTDDNDNHHRDGIPHRTASAYTNASASIDMEWDFAPAVPAVEQLDQVRSSTPVEVHHVPTAMTDGHGQQPHQQQTGGYAIRRRPSRDSLMSNLSPLQEGTDEETSPSSATKESVGPMTKDNGSSSRSRSRGRSKKSGGTSSTKTSGIEERNNKGKDDAAAAENPTKRSKSGSRTRSSSGKSKSKTPPRDRSRRERPPPPPRDTERNNITSKKKKTNNKASQKKKSTSLKSATITAKETPKSAMKKAAKKRSANKKLNSTTNVSGDSGSVSSSSSSSSDFNIIVSDVCSVVTELTQDKCFDAPAAATATTAVSSSSCLKSAMKSPHTTKKATSSSNAVRRPPHQDQYEYLPKELPKRMPLYNGSDESASPTSTMKSSICSTKSPVDNNKATAHQYQQQQEQQQNVHPSVEAFLASAMKHARLSKSFGNLMDFDEDDNDMIPSTDDDSSAQREVLPQRQNHRERSDNNTKSTKNHHHRKNFQSEPDLLARRDYHLPSAYMPHVNMLRTSDAASKDGYTTTSSLHASDFESVNDAKSRSNKYSNAGGEPKSPSQLLQTILAQSYPETSKSASSDDMPFGRPNSSEYPSARIRQTKRASMQSMFSEDMDSFGAPGEDYDC